jgi:anaerobic selenocysteine-containing dehydrogenase
VLFANEKDLAARTLAHGDVVDVETALPSGNRLRLTGLTAVASLRRRSSRFGHATVPRMAERLELEERRSDRDT